MMPSTTTSSEQPPSSVPREPKSSSSQVEASRGSNSQNSDDEDEDDDDDDDWLTRPRPHLRFSPEVGHDHDHDHREPSRDGPSAAAASSSSSSAPKVVDNGAVPAEVAAAVLPVPFRLSLVLRNTGSVARDHLASERTFLAYVRTSLSFASAGVALVQLFRVSVSASANGSSASPVTASFARPLGATLVGFGMAVLLVGTQRYFIIQRALPLGLFPAARLSVLLQAVSLAVLVGIVFGILVAVR